MPTVRRDPERHEIDRLIEYAGDLQDKRVLEIGAGYGRLTWRFAPLAGEVVGIDPDPERIARALSEMPDELRGKVTMLETSLEDYGKRSNAGLFDVALMSWAL